MNNIKRLQNICLSKEVTLRFQIFNRLTQYCMSPKMIANGVLERVFEVRVKFYLFIFHHCKS